MAPSVVDPDNKYMLLSTKYSIKGVDEGLSRSYQIKSVPILKEVHTDKKIIKEEKAKNKVNLKVMFFHLKVQVMIHCRECDTERDV